MADLGKVVVVMLLYALAFTAFGSVITMRKKENSFSFTKAILFGFFLYHVTFQIVALPVMFAQKPLSWLSCIWAIIAFSVIVWSAIRYGKVWIETAFTRLQGLIGTDKWGWVPLVITGLNVILVSVIYVSFWDATYYVGQVSFSVYTNTINMIDPLSGDYLQVFDLKHCLATYHVNDAVICQIFNLPALIETKTVMVAVIAVLTNVLYYRIGCKLFQNRKEAVALFMLLTLVLNLCTYSAYTASSFFMYRTYEGKAITANLSIPAVLYLLLDMYRNGEKKEMWWYALLVCWGSVAIASSAMFLIPGTLASGMVPYAMWKKRPAMLAKMIVAILPCIVVITCYLLGRIGWLQIAIGR